MKIFKILILTLIIVSCAPIHVNYDFEKGTDFTSYKTYNYYGDMQTGLSELDTKRMLDILNANMKAKGLSLSDDPDFLINIQSSEFQESQRSSVGVGVGGGGRNVGGGISIGLPLGQANINRQIIIDFADENKNGLFWQAVSESNFNPNGSPQSRTERLHAIITKMLSQYPPK
jgi:hypothetical protein